MPLLVVPFFHAFGPLVSPLTSCSSSPSTTNSNPLLVLFFKQIDSQMVTFVGDSVNVVDDVVVVVNIADGVVVFFAAIAVIATLPMSERAVRLVTRLFKLVAVQVRVTCSVDAAYNIDTNTNIVIWLTMANAMSTINATLNPSSGSPVPNILISI